MTLSLSKARGMNFKLIFPILPETEDIDDSKLYNINIVDTVLPSISITPLELPWQGGQVYQEGGGMEYGEWKTKFQIDQNFNNYILLYDWLTSAYDGISVFGSLTNDYQITANLLVLDNWDNVVVTWEFKKLWPSSLGDVQFSYKNGSEILECDVVFIYDFFIKKI